MVALYRPGPMAHIPTYIARKEGRQAGRVPGPVARRPARRDLRDHRLPGPGAPDRAARRRLLARPGRHPAPRDGQERPRGDAERARPASSTAPKKGLLRAEVAEQALGVHRAVRRLRLQQGPRGLLRLRRLPDGLSEGELPGRVDGRRPHHRRREAEKIVSALGECRRLGIAILRRTSTAVRFASPSSGGRTGSESDEFEHGIRFGLAAVKNVGEGAVEIDRRRAREERAVQVARRLCAAGSICAP